MHITNQYLDLSPVVARNAEALHARAIYVDDTAPDDRDYVYESEWMLLSTNPSIFDQQAFRKDTVEPSKVNPRVPLWTDDFSNVFRVLR